MMSGSTMTGGVSSDIYRADLPRRVICIKRALPKLKVAADWHAPVIRGRYEVEWMRVAAAIVPSGWGKSPSQECAGGPSFTTNNWMH